MSCCPPTSGPPSYPFFAEHGPPSSLPPNSTSPELLRPVDRTSPADHFSLATCSDQNRPSSLRRSSRLAAKSRGMKLSPLQRAQDLMCRKLKLPKLSYKARRPPSPLESPSSAAEPQCRLSVAEPQCRLSASHQAINAPPFPPPAPLPPRMSDIPDPSRDTSLPLSAADIKKIMSACGIVDKKAAASTSPGSPTEI